MRRRIDRLYHLAEAENLASILKHGLMSTERLVRLAGPLRGRERDAATYPPADECSPIRWDRDPGLAADASDCSGRCIGERT
jgi:hypothetical protein